MAVVAGAPWVPFAAMQREEEEAGDEMRGGTATHWLSRAVQQHGAGETSPKPCSHHQDSTQLLKNNKKNTFINI